MKKTLTRLLIGFILMSTSSCVKDNAPIEDCFPGQATSRQVMDQAATIRLNNGKYYIIEAGTIDLKLLACNLDENFKQDGL
jgi:hypothetical protein